MPAGIQLDLGAAVKAWAADRAADRIGSRLSCGVLVSLGGDIAVAGPAPELGWQIRVQDVTGPPQDPPAGPTGRRLAPGRTALAGPDKPRLIPVDHGVRAIA
jgi:thiamine biosynthesis lipoprotein